MTFVPDKSKMSMDERKQLALTLGKALHPLEYKMSDVQRSLPTLFDC